MATFLQKQFEDVFHLQPRYVISAPGRINMIGEHIDHNNYSVLPISIDLKNHVAIATCDNENEDFMTLQNHESDQFPTKSFTTTARIDVDASHGWDKYILAGYTGVCEYLLSGGDKKAIGTYYQKAKLNRSYWDKETAKLFPKNMKILVWGNLPKAVGLSSSSSLVIASFSAFLLAAKSSMSLTELCEACSNAERHVGTAGGQMDQASICLSQAGSALHIYFNPLRSYPVELPSNTTIVLANSCVVARKVDSMYNTRVFECKVGAILLLKKLKGGSTLSIDLMDSIHFEYVQRATGKSIEQMLDEVERLIKKKPYTKPEVLEAIGEEWWQALLQSRIGYKVWEKSETFEIYSRAKHVYSEALRVLSFVNVCKDKSMTESTKVEKLGLLMNDSDFSCNNLFECGCDELRELTAVSRKWGALGSRLTGAGWGGFTISLVESCKAAILIENLKEEFFSKYMNLHKDLDSLVFPARLSHGVSMYSCKGDSLEEVTWAL